MASCRVGLKDVSTSTAMTHRGRATRHAAPHPANGCAQRTQAAKTNCVLHAGRASAEQKGKAYHGHAANGNNEDWKSRKKPAILRHSFRMLQV